MLSNNGDTIILMKRAIMGRPIHVQSQSTQKYTNDSSYSKVP